MKKLIALTVVLALALSPLCAFATETETSNVDIYAIIDALSPEELHDVQEYVDTKISVLNSAPIGAETDAEDIEASRENPALVGDRVIVEMENADVAMTILYSYRGKPADIFLKSFNRYNISWLDKGLEWVLCYVKLEGLGASTVSLALSDYDIHLVSKGGVIVSAEFTFIMDNPKAMSTMYGDSKQVCWIGYAVPKDEPVYLTYQPEYDGDTYWFDVALRRQVDTAALDYPDIKKGDTGETVDAMQMVLVEYGYLTKLPSGKYDSNTISALKKFQKAVGIKADGVASDETLQRLFSGAPIE